MSTRSDAAQDFSRLTSQEFDGLWGQKARETLSTFQRILTDYERGIWQQGVNQILNQISSGATTIDNPLRSGFISRLGYVESYFPTLYKHFNTLFGDNDTLDVSQVADYYGISSETLQQFDSDTSTEEATPPEEAISTDAAADLEAEAEEDLLAEDEDLLGTEDVFVQVEEGAEDGDPFFEPRTDIESEFPEQVIDFETDPLSPVPPVTFEDSTEEAGGGGATDATEAADTGEAADAADATDVATEATDVATEATQTDVTSTTDEAGDSGMLTTGGGSTEAGRPAEIGDKITDGRGTIWIYTGRSPINPNVGIWVAENPDDILIEEYELQTGRVWDEETQIGAVVGTEQDASTVISEATQDIPEPGQTEEPTSAEEEKEEGVTLRDILDVFLETGTGDTTTETGEVTTETGEVTTETGEVTTETGEVTTGAGDTTTAVTTVGTGDGTGVSDTGTAEGGDAGAGAGDAGDTTTVGTGVGTEGLGDEGEGDAGIGTDGTGEGTGGDGTGDGTGGGALVGAGGMFSPKPFQGYMGGLSYQLPEFRGVYYQPRDYDVELNRIIQQSLFQGMY